jgi:hypothetical protein
MLNDVGETRLNDGKTNAGTRTAQMLQCGKGLTASARKALQLRVACHQRGVSEIVRACMHVRANGQQHLYCGCTVSAGGFANISISSAGVRWTVVNDSRS